MTVSELISQLNDLPQDAEVYLPGYLADTSPVAGVLYDTRDNSVIVSPDFD